MFIGRDSELSALKQVFTSEQSSISAIYGRRRIGKSALIAEAARGFTFYSFEGIENQSRSAQVNALLFQLKEYGCSIPEHINAKGSWLEVLALLGQLVDKKRAKQETSIILLDEFQWLANYRSEIVSQLKLIWDQKLAKLGSLKLVLCGSVASFIVEKVIKSKALYGRVDLEINLKEISLANAKSFFPDKGIEEIATGYLLFGGVPKYLQLLNDKSSIIQSVQFHCYRNLGYFATEYDKIFVSHFAKNASYENIVRLLANKRYGASRLEMATALGLPNSGELSRLLSNLELAGFIDSYIPFDKPINSKLKRYILTDFYLSFYLNFIEPLLRRGTLEQVDFNRDVFFSSEFRTYLGKAFEILCFKQRDLIARILGFGAIRYQAGPYFKHSKDGSIKGEQVDLLYKRADQVYTACEVKYTDKPVPLNVGVTFAKSISNIPSLSNKTVQRVSLSRERASKELVDSGHFYRVIDLARLFSSAEF